MNKPCIATLLLAIGGTAAHAFPITLDTAWMDANGRLSLSQDARQTLALTNIAVSASGEATAVGEGVFNLPITRIGADIALLPPKLEMNFADVKGSSLDFFNGITQTQASLANLKMDFEQKLIFGDLVSGGRVQQIEVFSFDVISPIAFSFQGGLSVVTQMGNIHFTDAGAKSFANALSIPEFLAPVFTQADFGVIDAKVTPWFRPSAKSIPAVPEPPALIMVLCGLLALSQLQKKRYHA